MLNDKVYNVLKPIATTVLPGLGALYFTLAQIWGLPNAEEVVGTIAAVNVFLGLLINVTSVQYNRSDKKYDGAIDVEEGAAGQKMFTLDLGEMSPYDLENKNEVLFRIRK